MNEEGDRDVNVGKLPSLSRVPKGYTAKSRRARALPYRGKAEAAAADEVAKVTLKLGRCNFVPQKGTSTPPKY